MYGIQILETEHQNILTMTSVLRAICIDIMHGKGVPVDDLRRCIVWIREYADTHHHGKEEEILFAEMTQHAGPAAEKLIGAMLIEHDMGRFHMTELEKALDAWKSGDDEIALDVITHASGYAELLVRHAGKEDAVVYPFAKRSLSSEILADVDERTKQFEEDFDVSTHLHTLRELQDKYLSV